MFVIYVLILTFIQFLFSEEDSIKFRQDYLEKKVVKISSETYQISDSHFSYDVFKHLTLFEFYLNVEQNIELAENIANNLQQYYPVKQLVNYSLGKHYYKIKNYDRAKFYLNLCVDSDSQFHEARKLLAEVCFRLKDYKKALEHYKVLSMFRPDKDVLKVMDCLSQHVGKSQIKEQKISFSTIHFSTSLTSLSIDVGISTKDNGRPLDINSIKFYVSNNFFVYNDKTEKLFEFNGSEDKPWVVTYRKNLKMFAVISPQLNKEYRIRSKYIIIQPVQRQDTIFISEYRKFKKSYIQNLEYRGMLVINAIKDNIVVINRLPLDDYLFSVVAKEIGTDIPYEALKVQSVVARTLALYRKKNKLHKFFDVCSGQHCQVYDGVRSEKENIINAVVDTQGEVIMCNDKLIHAFFHANCGGIANLWQNFHHDGEKVISDILGCDDYKIENFYYWYLLPPKLYCSGSDFVHLGFSRWLRVVEKHKLSKYLNEKYNIGEVKSIVILGRRKNGYVNKLKIVGSKKTILLSQEHKIRNITPNGPLRSSSFIVEYNKNNDSFYFWGAGWGHGVGMCQSGVVNLASQGENYVNIIKHYYPETEIKKIY